MNIIKYIFIYNTYDRSSVSLFIKDEFLFIKSSVPFVDERRSCCEVDDDDKFGIEEDSTLLSLISNSLRWRLARETELSLLIIKE